MDSAPANIAAVSIDIVYFTEDPESWKGSLPSFSLLFLCNEIEIFFASWRICYEALLCFVTYYNFLVHNVHKEFNTHTHLYRGGLWMEVIPTESLSLRSSWGVLTHQLVLQTLSLLTSSCVYIVPGCPSRTFRVYSMHIQTSCDVIVSLWHCNVDK
jgi:hypothetical protein